MPSHAGNVTISSLVAAVATCCWPTANRPGFCARPGTAARALAVAIEYQRRHSMGLTFSSTNAISSVSRPYLAYNCWSISEIDFVQSMSDALVKS